MGNNTSQIRKSTAYNESNIRKSSTSRTNHHNLDEEFSDLILHEVKKDGINNNDSNNKEVNGNDHKEVNGLKYNKFSNDLIEDEFNELNDLIVTDAQELSRNIIHGENDDDMNIELDESNSSIDTDIQSQSTTDANQTLHQVDDIHEGNDMEIDSTNSPPSHSNITTPDTPTPDLSSVDFTKVISTQPQLPSMQPSVPQSIPQSIQQRQSQPIQQMGTLPNRRPNNSGISSPSNFAYGYNNSNNNNNVSSGNSPNLTTLGSSMEKLVNVEIKWVNNTKEDIQKISIIGSFSNWRNIIRLKQSIHHPNEFNVTIKLPLGVHKLLYIINNEYRVSEQLPTATDQEGIFFNWFEVINDQHLFNHSQNQPNRINASTKYDANIIQSAGQFEINEIKRKSNSFLAKISKEEPNIEHVEFMDSSVEHEQLPEQQEQGQRPQQAQQPVQFVQPPNVDNQNMNGIESHQGSFSDKYIMMSDNNSSSFLLNEQSTKLEYSNDIPEIFVNYNYFKSQNENFELPEPPQLPAHLNNVLLNKISNINNSSGSVNNLHGNGNGYGHHVHGHTQLTNLPQFDSIKAPSAFLTDSNSSTSSTSNSIAGSKRPPLRRADSSYYASNREAYHQSIPNHVILNHLMTTSIRNDVLTVACITRYSGKFVTQIMHSPADTG